jgi:hypothetical protein
LQGVVICSTPINECCATTYMCCGMFWLGNYNCNLFLAEFQLGSWIDIVCTVYVYDANSLPKNSLFRTVIAWAFRSHNQSRQKAIRNVASEPHKTYTNICGARDSAEREFAQKPPTSMCRDNFIENIRERERERINLLNKFTDIRPMYIHTILVHDMWQ